MKPTVKFFDASAWSKVFAIISFISFGSIHLKAQLSSSAAASALQRIESGLIPSIGLEVDKGKTYSLEERRAFYNVPGVSIALIENGVITSAKGYGITDSTTKKTVTPETMFQVASVSKAITAVGVLKLVETRSLDLDKNINSYLTTWKVPESALTLVEKVTIRRLLNHTAGINIGGFTGYTKNSPQPSIDAILNGQGNTPKIVVEAIPGSKFQYSGGGYVILVKLIEDLTGTSFEEYMQEAVFKPLGMQSSTFRQTPQGNVSFGHDQDGKATEGGWNTMPELAPNGLWTTPIDLAKMCIALQESLNPKARKQPFLKTLTMKEMLTPSGFMSYGLGVAVKKDSTTNFFFHAGQNPGGFSAMMINIAEKGDGIVIATNSEDVHLMREITNGYAAQKNLGYARGFVGSQMLIKPHPMSSADLAEYTGKYVFEKQADMAVRIESGANNTLAMKYLYNGYTAYLTPITKDKFFEIYTEEEIVFTRNGATNLIQNVQRRGKIFLRK
jgi:CubicO group peptidase (beta-lactamase class C family)